MTDVIEHPAPAPAPHPGTIDVGGTPYLRDVRGALVPMAAIKTQDLLIDETVRKIIGYATDLSAQIGRFKGHTFEDVGSLVALLAQEYETQLGGRKGNITLMSYDGCMKVQVQVADVLEFGPELQPAKAIIDECLTEWASDAPVNLRALVTSVFQVEKEGKINSSELFMLLRYEIDDERWKRAMKAIGDSIRIVGSRTYIRFYTRPAPDAAWSSITIDLAAA